MRILAKVVKQIYHNDTFYIWGCVPVFKENSNTDNGKIKLNSYGNFSLVGDIGYLIEGKEYVLDVEEKETNKYGTSYTVTACLTNCNTDMSQMSRKEKLDILLSVTTSERIANNILDNIPDYIEQALTKSPEEIDISKIKGVGTAYNNAYCRDLKNKFKYYMLGQNNDLRKYQLTVDESKALYNTYSELGDILKVFQNNPYYVLIEICHRSFDATDEILRDIRKDLVESDERTEALIMEVLKRNEQDGNTRLNGTKLYQVVKLEYSHCRNLIPKLKDVSVKSQMIYFDELTGDLSLMSTYSAECQVAEFVKEKINQNNVINVSDEELEKYRKLDEKSNLTDEQFGALKIFTQKNLSLLIGFAGSGKTSSLKSIIRYCDDHNLTYTLLAPTGAASLRFSESTGRNASTIHLKCLRDQIIDTDVLIVDESSMIDLETFCMMLNCISNENIRVVLVGDIAQLTPVSVGTIFADLVKSGKIPSTILTKIFRYNESGMLYAATNERKGRFFLDDDCVKYRDGVYSINNNYKFIEKNNANLLDEILKQYLSLIKKKVNPLDILVLSPFNVGDYGTYNINNLIQAEINPPKPNEKIFYRNKRSRHKIIFRVGDRVINTKNDYEAIPLDMWREIEASNGVLSVEDMDRNELATIYNGQRGIVTDIQDKYMVCQFNNQLIVFTANKAKQLLLGYSITIHKSQGQEVDYVITVFSKDHTKLMNRNLIYVADTRAKVKQVDIGETEVIRLALLKDGVEMRNTWELDLLNQI